MTNSYNTFVRTMSLLSPPQVMLMRRLRDFSLALEMTSKLFFA